MADCNENARDGPTSSRNFTDVPRARYGRYERLARSEMRDHSAIPKPLQTSTVSRARSVGTARRRRRHSVVVPVTVRARNSAWRPARIAKTRSHRRCRGHIVRSKSKCEKEKLQSGPNATVARAITKTKPPAIKARVNEKVCNRRRGLTRNDDSKKRWSHRYASVTIKSDKSHCS